MGGRAGDAGPGAGRLPRRESRGAIQPLKPCGAAGGSAGAGRSASSIGPICCMEMRASTPRRASRAPRRRRRPCNRIAVPGYPIDRHAASLPRWSPGDGFGPIDPIERY